jgi:hypothetical protein
MMDPDNITYLIGFSHEEIRENRQALVHFASEYLSFAQNPAFDTRACASYTARAKLLIDLADRMSTTIQRHVTLQQERKVSPTVIIAEYGDQHEPLHQS